MAKRRGAGWQEGERDLVRGRDGTRRRSSPLVRNRRERIGRRELAAAGTGGDRNDGGGARGSRIGSVDAAGRDSGGGGAMAGRPGARPLIGVAGALGDDRRRSFGKRFGRGLGRRRRRDRRVGSADRPDARRDPPHRDRRRWYQGP